MKTFADKLRDARNALGLKQSDVAKQLDCAPTSLTNWENGKVQPSLEVLSRICSIYGISPLSLLDREYSYNDIVEISGKPVPDRSYEEQIALNFSEPMLARLLLTEQQRLDAKRNEETAAFLQNTDLLNRFGGSLNKEQIEAVQTEYETNGSSDADILFAFHALNDNSKKAFLSMTAGMLMQDCNIQRFNEEMDKATKFTLDRLQKAITGEPQD